MKINISPIAYSKLKYYILATDLEISGMGKVIKGLDNSLIITDVFIYKQIVSGAHTDIDKEEMMKELSERAKRGEDISEYKLWWHSHNTMDAFFSGTDLGTIREFGETAEYLISIVGNHDMEFKTRLDIFKPLCISVENIKLSFDYHDPKLKYEIQKEVDKKVSGSKYKMFDNNRVWSKNKNNSFKKNNKEIKEYHGFYCKCVKCQEYND